MSYRLGYVPFVVALLGWGCSDHSIDSPGGAGGSPPALAGTAGQGGSANSLAGDGGNMSPGGHPAGPGVGGVQALAGNGGSGANPPGGGGGALPGIPCSEPFEVEGERLAGCIGSVAGVKLKFFPLPPQTPVKRVSVYFHGDSAQDWYDWYPYMADMVRWCQERSILLVAPLSPVAYADDPPEERSFGAAFADEAEQVGSALEAFLDAYGAPHRDLLYWSTSGGSWFSTSAFLPLLGARLPGAYALSCGGSEGWYDYVWDIESPTRSLNRLLFNYGSEDFLRPGEEASAEKFRMDGFTVSVVTHPGAEHCDHEINPPTTSFWEAVP